MKQTYEAFLIKLASSSSVSKNLNSSAILAFNLQFTSENANQPTCSFNISFAFRRRLNRFLVKSKRNFTDFASFHALYTAVRCLQVVYLTITCCVTFPSSFFVGEPIRCARSMTASGISKFISLNIVRTFHSTSSLVSLSPDVGHSILSIRRHNLREYSSWFS